MPKTPFDPESDCHVNDRTHDIDDDQRASFRSKVFNRHAAVFGALLAFVALGVVLILNYAFTDTSVSNFRDLKVVCVTNEDDYHGFVVKSADLIKHLRSRTPIKCPECGGEELARATECVSCNLFIPTGVHGLPPDNCSHCGFRQPPPTVGDHEMLHSPGSHGEEAVIVPLLDDDQPQ